jgi:hypothetical protein
MARASMRGIAPILILEMRIVIITMRIIISKVRM